MMKRILVVISLLALMVTIGCSNQADDYSHSEQADTISLNYEIGSNEWPPFIEQFATPEVLEAYQFAIDYPEVLDYMPCYCGCYEQDGHVNNTDCFVDSVEGNIAQLDSMGVG